MFWVVARVWLISWHVPSRGPRGGEATRRRAPVGSSGHTTTAPDTASMDWNSQWYPVANTRHLRKKEPNALRLLETSLVAWQSSDGAWTVAEDRCPHRGAPLSYARLETNRTLTCAYHGWQFDGTGASTYVPVRRTQGCSACLRVHPSRVCAHGLLWVWPVSCSEGDANHARAMDSALPVDHLPDPDRAVTDWTVNRVPVAWASLLENTLDDAHGVHAHHGFAGLDRTIARPAHRVVSGESGTGSVFSTWCNVSGPLVASSLVADGVNQDNRWVNSYRFMAPHRTTVCFGTDLRAEGFVVPSAHDETLLISAAFSTSLSLEVISCMRHVRLANPFLTAVMHRLGASVVCQDAVLIEAEGLDELRGDRWTGERTRGGLTPPDGAVHRLRGWIRRSGGPPLRPSRDAVRDWTPRRSVSVWHMHTRDCPTCRRAHRDAKATSRGMLVVGLAFAASGHVALSLACLAHAEFSRGIERWFEEFDVDFRR